MQNLCLTILNSLLTGTSLVLASIITQSGSAPRTAGARMLVYPDGSIWGTVGGGRYEAETMRAAWALLGSHREASGSGGAMPAKIMRFALNNAGDMDMICGGDVLILLELISPYEQTKNMFELAAKAQEAGAPFLFASSLSFAQDISDPACLNGVADGSITRLLYLPEHCETLPAGAPARNELLQGIKAPAPFISPQPCGPWLLEPFSERERIHIIGAGHVSKALADIAETTGFATIVLDDRAEFATRERFPHSRLVLPPDLSEKSLDNYFGVTPINRHDAVVIVTRGHAFDKEALAASLRTGAGYIGMIGSSAKRTQIYDALLKNGFAQNALQRVHSPIGLPIGAETPEEIAVSIMAQLIQWRRGKL